MIVAYPKIQNQLFCRIKDRKFFSRVLDGKQSIMIYDELDRKQYKKEKIDNLFPLFYGGRYSNW